MVAGHVAMNLTSLHLTSHHLTSFHLTSSARLTAASVDPFDVVEAAVGTMHLEEDEEIK